MSSSDGYFIDVDESGLGNCLVLAGAWRDEFARVAVDADIKVLRLSSGAGWKEQDISFVRALHFLEGVEVYSFDVTDVSPVFELPQLRYVGLQCNFKAPTNFHALKNLEICKILWSAKAEDLWTCTKLQHLNIVNYPGVDLVQMASFNQLRRLQISGKKLTTLDGIERMPHLRKFDAANCPKLSELDGLEQCKLLESIEIDGCRRIGKLPDRLDETRLETLLLTDCGKIESLAPLAAVDSLRTLKFVGDTTVLDGALNFLENLPSLEKVWYASRRNYSITREELSDRLAAKRRA